MDKTTPPPSPRPPEPMTPFGIKSDPRSVLPPPDTAVKHASTANFSSVHALAANANLPPTPRPAAPILTPGSTPGTPGIEQHRKNRPIQRWLTHREHTRRAEKSPMDTRGSSSTTQATLPSTTSTPGDERLIDSSDDDNAAVIDGPTQDPDFTSSDSESEIDSVDSSDSESTDDEFGTSDNPKMDPKTRAGLEAMIFEGKENTTLRYKAEWEKAKKREDLYVKEHRVNKYAWDLPAGSANQLTSFAIGGIAVAFTGNPWLFPVVSCLASDLVGDRLAQVIRKSTIVTHATKEHFENQRRCARAMGDLIESCAGKEPKRKFLVTTGKDADGNPIKEKMTAAEALENYGRLHALSTAGKNLLVRGLPFLWFTLIYSARDYYLNARCYDTFNPTPANASMGAASHPGNSSNPAAGCPNSAEINPEALAWGMIILGGMLAGATTSITGQMISSFLPGEERTNYVPDTWKLQMTYLESARIDTKLYLDKLATTSYRKELHAQGMDDEEIAVLERAAHSLKGIQDKEFSLARKKSSYWTTFQAELDQATQKHRDETVISPEFGGKRLDLFLSMMGKFASLLVYAYFLSAFNPRKANSDSERLQDVLLIPMSLIVIGYALRDDCRLVAHVPYGAVKGMVRACKSQPQEENTADVTTNLKKVTVREEATDASVSHRNNDDDESEVV